ncbi:MAG: (2Fe-2S)-binding protein [Ignavibacteria bacterium]
MVDRCICFDKKFSDLKILIDKHKLKNIDDLRRYFLFGENCKTCIPYIEMIFDTGRTEFKPVFNDNDRETA